MTQKSCISHYELLKIYPSVIRLKDWWNFIVPPILGFYLWGIYQANLPLAATAVRTLGFTLLTFSVASFGFFLNEWTDLSDDTAAGKANRVTRLSCIQAILLMGMMGLQALIGLRLCLHSCLHYILLSIEISLLILYSANPFRLKKNLYLAPLLDALYSGTVFYVLAISVNYQLSPNLPLAKKCSLALMFIWALSKGLRNIVMHLLSDAKHDAIILNVTVGTMYEDINVLRFLWLVIYPTEVLSFCGFSLFSNDLSGWLLLASYLISERNSLMSMLFNSIKEPSRAGLFAVNVFYESIFPLVVLFCLIVSVDWSYLVYLVAMIACFSGIRNTCYKFLLSPLKRLRSLAK